MFLEGEERGDVVAVMISRDWRGGMDWIHGSFIFILFVCVRVCVCVCLVSFVVFSLTTVIVV